MSGMDRLTELLPCPFCGDNHATTTYTRDGRLVVCTSCGAKSGNYYHGPKDLPSADERAIAAWNRRASQAAPAPKDGKPEWLSHCAVCRRVIDTREECDGGDPHGCEVGSDFWVCSPECWDAQCVGDGVLAAPAPSGGLRVPKTLTAAQLADACMSYRHDYGLMIGDEREDVRREAAEWWRCFEKTLNDPPAHLRAALSASPAQEGGE